MKLVWIYLCDSCDHAGVWDINLTILSAHIGESVTLNEITEFFGDKIQVLSSEKIAIPSFLDFQYGTLNPQNRVHKSILNRLIKEGVCKPLVSPLEGAKDKDKDNYINNNIKDKKNDAVQNFELRFNKEYQEFEKAILDVVGSTPFFRTLLPKMYEQWKDDKPGLIELIEGRIASAEKLNLNHAQKKAWLRKALINESALGAE